MKIVEPYATMLSPVANYDGPDPNDTFTPEHGIGMLKRVEYAARVSHGSEEAITPDSWNRFLRSVVLQHGDWSVTEHEKVTCEFLIDRGISHELVRHRIGSYTQESTRFINYKKKGGEARFVCPFPIEEDGDAQSHELKLWHDAMESAESTYMLLLDNGVKPQIARSALPNALATKIIVTYNLRTWRHFFVMRTCAQAHPQMRQVTDRLLVEFQANIPILYEDIVPGMQQAEAMRLAR